MYEPLPVTSDDVAKWRGLIEHHAGRYSKYNRTLAEFDDLVQVGMIRVWKLLRRGYSPSELAIRHAMIDELRRCERLDRDSDPINDDLDEEFLALDGVGA